MSSIFAGKNVLITGASSGLGAALARLFGADGARLALVARRGDRLRALAAELPAAAGAPHLVATADLAAPAECEAVAQQIEREMSGVDVLINNAGLGELGTFATVDAAATQRMLDVNIISLTRLTRAFAPAMMARRQGWIMNVASVAAFGPIPLMGVYAATKSYVLSFSEALAYEMRPHGVRVCCICPGTTRTEFFHRGGFEAKAEMINKFAMPVERVAKIAYSALQRGRMTLITGQMNAAQVWLQRFIPRRTLVDVTGWIINRMRGDKA